MLKSHGHFEDFEPNTLDEKWFYFEPSQLVEYLELLKLLTKNKSKFSKFSHGHLSHECLSVLDIAY